MVNMNKTIRGGAREIIYKVFLQCLAEYQAGKILTELGDVYQRTADLTGKSESTVRRIVNEGKTNGKFGTPAKYRKGRPRKDLDDFDICAIRQKIHFFYTVQKEVPTIKKLLPLLRADIGYDGSREHLWNLLLAIGFKYKKCTNNRLTLIEKPNISAKREEYLKIIIENRNLPEELQKDIIYLDESYIHSTYKLKKCWQSIDTQGVVNDIAKGKRYIIVHAGSEKGFVPNALLIFSGNNKQEDYHSEMNRHNFKKWVQEMLIPNLHEPSIIVMDNAPYHSVLLNKAPNSNSKINDIKTWLTENNIDFDPLLRKPLLYQIVKRNKMQPIYEIDEILAEHGHTVVRLPPYHCDLNPIELIWSLAKRKVAALNVGGARDIKELTQEAFNSITAVDWKQCIQHVKKIEKEYYERGRTLYHNIDELIISVREEESSSSEDSVLDSDDDIPFSLVSSSQQESQPSTSANSEMAEEMFEEYLDFDLFDE